MPELQLTDSSINLVRLLSSKNPSVFIRALVNSEIGYFYNRYPKNFWGYGESFQKSEHNNNKTLKLFDYLLDPEKKMKNENRAFTNISEYIALFQKLNKFVSLPFLFSALWYSRLPCIDVKGITSEKLGDRSILKYCQWKGKTIPCSAIFTTFPTDQGMCCTFNIQATEDIFQGKYFAQMVEEHQTEDKQNSFENSTPPEWCSKSKKRKSQSGISNGLYFILDGHYDLMAGGSIDSDFLGFTGLVHSSGSFPMVYQHGFQIKTGHNTFIAVKATQIDTKESLRSIQPEQRKCILSDETRDLRIHKKYSQTNCLLECSLRFAQTKLSEHENVSQTCTPWYFPFEDQFRNVCDPWRTKIFHEYMVHNIPEDVCSHCLPDCSKTVYHPFITSLPFKVCDESNLGLSKFCDLEDKTIPEPRLWSQQVMQEYAGCPQIPDFFEKC